jgi:hypothetical protein
MAIMNTKRSIFIRLVSMSAVVAVLLSFAPTALPLAQSGTADTQSVENQPIMINLLAPPPAPFPLNPSWCIPDVDGPNDEAQQKDLTRLCLDTTTDPTKILVEWDWDEIGTSGANTMDASIFFDSDDDGFANYAVFVTTQNSPATIVPQPAGIRYATCPDDNSATQCGGAVEVVPLPSGIDCYVNSPVGTDPFPAGADYPNDAVGYCAVARSLFPTPPPVTTLLNVCSRTSESLTSDRSDCIASEGGGFILVKKFEVPPYQGDLFWNFTLNNGTSNYCVPISLNPDNTTGLGSKLCSVPASTYTITETVTLTNTLAGYSFYTSQCTDENTNVVGTGNGTPTVSGLVLTSGSSLTCEYYNSTPTAVGVSNFEATRQKKGVELTWNSVSESDVAGYNIFRNGELVNAELIPAKHKNQNAYSFLDDKAKKNGAYDYELQVVYSDNSKDTVGQASVGSDFQGKGTPKNK